MEAGEQRSALHVPPDEGRSYWLLGELYTVKALGEDTNGAVAFVEAITPPQAGPPPHIHNREDETFWVLEGELEFLVGDGTTRAPAGSLVHVPKGTLHTYKNVGTMPARYLLTINPADFEKLFMEVGEPAEDRSAPPPAHGQEVIDRLLAAAPKHGVEIPPPPE